MEVLAYLAVAAALAGCLGYLLYALRKRLARCLASALARGRRRGKVAPVSSVTLRVDDGEDSDDAGGAQPRLLSLRCSRDADGDGDGHAWVGSASGSSGSGSSASSSASSDPGTQASPEHVYANAVLTYAPRTTSAAHSALLRASALCARADEADGDDARLRAFNALEAGLALVKLDLSVLQEELRARAEALQQCGVTVILGEAGRASDDEVAAMALEGVRGELGSLEQSLLRADAHSLAEQVHEFGNHLESVYRDLQVLSLQSVATTDPALLARGLETVTEAMRVLDEVAAETVTVMAALALQVGAAHEK